MLQIPLLRIARVVKWQTRTFEGRMPKGVGVQVPPRALKLLYLRNLRFRTAMPFPPLFRAGLHMRCYSIVLPCGCQLVGQAEPRPLQATLFQLGHTPINAWIQKMDVDGDGGRREFGLRSPLSRQYPNRPSGEGQAASASTAFDPLVEFL